MIRRPNGVGVIGLGAAFPDEVVGPPTVGASRQGVIDSGGAAIPPRQRRRAAVGQPSSTFEAAAGRAALASAGVTPDGVDLLMGYSQLPDEAAPGNHGIAAHSLGLPRTASAFTLDGGCASAIVHLNTAARLIECGDHQVALTYQSCLSSPILEPGSDAAVILGDGAAAQVVGRVDPELGLIGRVQHTRTELCRTLVLGARDGRPRWYEAGERLVVLPRDVEASVRVGALGAEFARDTCSELLAQCGVTAADVDFFVCPQATSWFADACAHAVGIRDGRWLSLDEPFHEYGHLLAASAPVNLWVAWRQRLLRPGDLVLLYSPGVGFTLAASLLRWALPPPPLPTGPPAPRPGTARAG